MAWPVCHKCGAKTVEVDKTSEVLNRREAVVLRAYRCADRCGWKVMTGEVILDDCPRSLRLRYRWPLMMIDRVAALYRFLGSFRQGRQPVDGGR